MILLDTSQTAIISAGNFESNPVGLGKSGTLEAITIQGGWGSSDITFVAAISDGGTYYPVYDANGNRVTIRNPKGNQFISLNSRVTRGIRFFKLVAEEVQGSDRHIVLHVSSSI